MKKIKFVAIAVLASLAFSSCSSDEILLPEENSKELFKTYQLKRDATGAYSFEIGVENGVSVGKVKNTTNNTNEIYLSESNDKIVQKSNYGSDLWFNDENFKIELISDNSDKDKAPSISIVDDNVKFAQKEAKSRFLKEYSITKNDEGSYDLDFKVKNKVSVDFVYDEENNIYEIHLEEAGKSKKKRNYSRNFDKIDGELLEIHFVNHFNSSGAKAASYTSEKPRIIII